MIVVESKKMCMEIEWELGRLLEVKSLSLSTAESCTGGGIAALVTSVPGSSRYFKGGIIAYSNEVKENLLHVQSATLKHFGAVSRETVYEMAKGVMEIMQTDCAIATSGVAGPGGGTKEKPVGTIWIAVAYKNDFSYLKQEEDCGRGANVQRAIKNALCMLKKMLK